MKVLVLGGTGATGRLVIGELLERGHGVVAIVRSAERVPEAVRAHERLRVMVGTALDMDAEALAEIVSGCEACVSCLGHAVSVRGIWGPPYRLVRDSVRRVCEAAAAEGEARAAPFRVVLMNSTGCRAPGERVSMAQRVVVGLVRVLVPPHADNESAARYLRGLNLELGSGSGSGVEWCVVRPDGLTDAEGPSEAVIHPSPVRSAIFDPGKTSRANAARFMAELAAGGEAWQAWRGRSPVIYNAQEG